MAKINTSLFQDIEGVDDYISSSNPPTINRNTSFVPDIFEKSWMNLRSEYTPFIETTSHVPSYDASISLDFLEDVPEEELDSTQSKDASTPVTFTSKQDFITKLTNSYRKAGVTNPELLRLLVAQDALESRWGQSALTKKTNNLGNIHTFKGSTRPYHVDTDHRADGSTYKVGFQVFNSLDEYTAYKWKMLQNKRYKLHNGSTYNDFLSAMKIYAEDPNYRRKISNIYSSL